MKGKVFIIKIIIIVAVAVSCNSAAAQLLSVKTNALLWGNLTPNLSMELVTTKKTSLEGTVFYSPNKTPFKTQLMGAQAEFRYWISGRPMNRLFVGGAITALRYDTSLGFGARHYGDAIAPGIVFGYALPIGDHWNIEFATGVGYFWYSEKRYGKDAENIYGMPYNEHGSRMIPTKLCVSFAYLF